MNSIPAENTSQERLLGNEKEIIEMKGQKEKELFTVFITICSKIEIILADFHVSGAVIYSLKFDCVLIQSFSVVTHLAIKSLTTLISLVC